MLFWVTTRGRSMMLTRPCVSSADSATSRLKAPLTLPSLMKALSALVLIEPADAAGGDRVGERQVGGVAQLGGHLAAEAPEQAEFARRRLGGADDARLDLDLRLRPIELGDQLLRLGQAVRDVEEDQRVGVLVDLDVAEGRHARLLDQVGDVLGVGVAEADGARIPSWRRPVRAAAPRPACGDRPPRSRTSSSARCGRWCRRRCRPAGWRAGSSRAPDPTARRAG